MVTFMKIMIAAALLAAGAGFVAAYVTKDGYFLLVSIMNLLVASYDLSLLTLKETEVKDGV